jgi:hypothetical protein
MGLFDTLPAPNKQAPGKRPADAAAVAVDDAHDTKKSRTYGQQPSNGAVAAAQADGGSGGTGGNTSSPWLGTLQAAYSEDKGARITMEGQCRLQCPSQLLTRVHTCQYNTSEVW